MRYHHISMNESFAGEIYICNHPVYSSCTLYRDGTRGLAVIQQRCRDDGKDTYWGELDMGLSKDIYDNAGFRDYFDARADAPTDDGLYPTVTARQIMWALRMKPLPKARWETVFDRRDI